MLDWTDRHCRYFHRLLSAQTLLYTEMVTTGAIIHGRGDFLAYNQEEHPVALQFGGSNPKDLAHCAKLAQERGYDEINLNVGCPSDRVQNGRFGACLMGEPDLVAECVAAMRAVVDIPVTRKAWLSGLSPKENREIPPLDYPRAYQIKRDFPHLTIAVNGGVKSLEEAKLHLQHLDGVMIGREAYQNPYLLAEVDQQIFGLETPVKKRSQVIHEMMPYIERELSQGTHLGHMTRHMLGLFQNMPGARQWRRHISENAHKPGAGLEVVEQALAKIPYQELGV
ncbi:tRNA-dihydrouridine(20/20a) synthase DusA [Vibrio cholerae]|uniref:tRNA-dihydrouridine(20/20a) synthase DusA n=1 Tax=Vibrio cholerae TaxID=666 RepID=UPI0013B4542E|nr:tRNA-dihydrouridine(20/20a) synthase DusA [Vibrio cholerae]